MLSELESVLMAPFRIGSGSKYEERLSWESLEEARKYVLSFPYLVYEALYDEKLQFSGIKVPKGRTTEKVLEPLRKSGIDRTVRYKGVNNKDEDGIDVMEMVKKYDMSYYKRHGYSVKIFEAKNANYEKESSINVSEDETEKLAKKIKSCKTCWNPFEDKSKVAGHIVDMERGGCKIAFIEHRNETVVFNRYYFLNGPDGQKELFLDTIEGQDMSRAYLSDWKREEVLDRLMLSIYAAVAVANVSGCSRVFMAESEAREFSEKMLKEFRRYPFYQKIGEKIGINPGDSGEMVPYFYNLARSRDKFPYLPLDYQVDGKEEVLEKERAVSETLERMEKGKKGARTEERIEVCRDVLTLCEDLKKL